MSRSYKKTPITGNACADSEKDDKRRASKARRAHFRTHVGSVKDVDSIEFDERSKVHGNNWGFAKDGRHWFGLAVARVGRALKVRKAPQWVTSEREAYKALGK